MDALKLIALDAEDLTILSAHLQDAVLTAGDMTFWKSEARFGLIARRFDWEGFSEGENRRRLSALEFGRVLGVKAQGIDPAVKDRVLNVLAIAFAESEAPRGEVIITFSDGAALKLEVECIEGRLTDLGPMWEASGVPQHPAA